MVSAESRSHRNGSRRLAQPTRLGPCSHPLKSGVDMPHSPKEPTRVCLDERELRRYLYDNSAVFTRAAHALEAAADQLREAQ